MMKQYTDFDDYRDLPINNELIQQAKDKQDSEARLLYVNDNIINFSYGLIAEARAMREEQPDYTNRLLLMASKAGIPQALHLFGSWNDIDAKTFEELERISMNQSCVTNGNYLLPAYFVYEGAPERELWQEPSAEWLRENFPPSRDITNYLRSLESNWKGRVQQLLDGNLTVSEYYSEYDHD